MRQDLQVQDLQMRDLQEQDCQVQDCQVQELYVAECEDRYWASGVSAEGSGEERDGAFTIAEIAGAFGVTPRALRFYESRGLLTPRRQGAARYFSEADRGKLALILKFKTLGFTLLEIRALIESQQSADHGVPLLSRAQCVEQINLLERQKRDIDQALSELRRAYSSHYVRVLEGAARSAD